MNRIAWVFVVLALPLLAAAQPKVEIRTEPVRGAVHVLYGRGGNIGLSIGDDGVLMIDDQYAPQSGDILAAVVKLTDEEVRFLVNTHWHQDHTGGNENLGSRGAVIVAHENVRRRLSEDQFVELFNNTVQAAPPAALPVITFTDSLTFHWNGDRVDVAHVPGAHTDGDAILHFRRANVFHMGDCYFNGIYPFIDSASGGSIDGMIAAADRVLAECDDDTRIIPGHGRVSGPEELRAFRAMLVAVRDRIQALMDQGKTREEIVAARPTAEFDPEWGGGFLEPDRWVAIVHAGMVRAAEDR